MSHGSLVGVKSLGCGQESPMLQLPFFFISKFDLHGPHPWKREVPALWEGGRDKRCSLSLVVLT